MARAPSTALEADIAAALDWWREAGVDAIYTDEPQPWLARDEAVAPTARTAPKPVAPVPPPRPQAGGSRDGWPTDLTTFGHWWLDEPSLDDGGLAPRIAPVGPAGAPLMVVVAMPEITDRDSLLSGPEGAMLDGFLRAAGLGRDGVRLATVLPRHTPLPDWTAIEQHGMARVLAHHVALAAPQRLIVLGRNILPLCGHDPAQGAAATSFFNHEGGKVPALFEAGLDRLIRNAPSRARLWKRWLDWTD